MLLIGSRAARFHYPSARKPRDFDFIARKNEVEDFLKNFSYKDTSSHDKKVRALVDLHGEKVSFEFELNTSYISSTLINNFEKDYKKDDELLGISYYVASPQTLFLLKKSHITFNIHWKKNIQDYLFLKKKIEGTKLPDWWEPVFRQRFSEITHRVNRKKLNFDVDNSDFFKRSEKFVNRLVEHDSLHYATCFYDKPLFLSAKEDLSKAALSPDKIKQMSHGDIIKMIQEECMALSLERYIIPSLISGKPYNTKGAIRNMAGKMVYNYLPPFMRFFAADHYEEISNLDIDYVALCLSRHKDLKNIISEYHLPSE